MTLLLLLGGGADALTIGDVESTAEGGGYVITGADVLRIGDVESTAVAAGYQSQPEPLWQRPIRVGGVDAGAIAEGYTLLTAAPVTGGDDPVVWMNDTEADAPGDDPVSVPGDLLVSVAMTVTRYPLATEIECQPAWNKPGTGSFTTEPPGPAENEIVGFDVGGHRQFTGHCSRVREVLVSTGEENDQLVHVDVVGLLDELRHAVVLPDFGAQDTSRLGEPVQDERRFDWTMNGIGTDDTNLVEGIDVIGSTSIDMVQGAMSKQFPLPDVWPDPWARWMWTRDLRRNQPQGWCHFRVPFAATPGKAQVWAATTDYCRVFIDGVEVLKCDTAYAAQHLDLEFAGKFHLATIYAFNLSGRTGVLFSVLPVQSDGLYGKPFMNSRSGWKSLAYPTRSFRLNPGQVLRRLKFEATKRDVAYIADWRFTFNASVDSAGRPWPANDPIILETGMNYVDVLDRLAEDLIDYRVATAGRVLDAFIKGGGTRRNIAAPWSPGVDLVSHERERNIEPWS